MSEVRFMKRKNLEEEARIVGNYYSDLIRNYGIDCIYHKLDTSVFGNFKGIVDKNIILKHAYGQNDSPDYSCSAMMITYPEVHQDLFNLQKYGYVPQAEIDFNFDAKQFACDLATKCGQLKEYKIKELDIAIEVPSNDDKASFPFAIDFGPRWQFECGILSGKLSVELPWYENYDEEHEIICDPYEHTDFELSFPKNSDLYASLQYKICSDSYIDSLIFLKYSIKKIAYGKDENGNTLFKSMLIGKARGSILFYDINAIGKYLELIHPEVGDIIVIGFPDDASREQYEITDCYDKSLQNDGISPLLHKYIWKCKAKRHVNSYEDIGDEHNEANERLEEKLKYDQVVEEEITKKISLYDEGDQEAYGGYDGTIPGYDKEKPSPYVAMKFDYLGEDEIMDIMQFECGSRLVTNGYDLVFITAPSGEQPGDGYVLATTDHEVTVHEAYFESGLRWLKASKEKLVFVNIEGDSITLAEDEFATEGEIQLCLNDLNEKTLDVGDINKMNQNFLKFKGCRSYMWATQHHLFAKLESNDQLYKLV